MRPSHAIMFICVILTTSGLCRAQNKDTDEWHFHKRKAR